MRIIIDFMPFPQEVFSPHSEDLVIEKHTYNFPFAASHNDWADTCFYKGISLKGHYFMKILSKK